MDCWRLLLDLASRGEGLIREVIATAAILVIVLAAAVDDLVLVNGHLELPSLDQTLPFQVLHDPSQRLFVHLMPLVSLELELDALAELYLRDVAAPLRLLDLI